MSQDTWPNGSYADFADLARRREALRQATAMPGADPRPLLDLRQQLAPESFPRDVGIAPRYPDIG